jgi:integrase
MGVKIREKPAGSGIWWVFVNHQGIRKAKKIGKNLDLAKEVAKKLDAKLTLGDFDLDDKREQILFRDYAQPWLEGYVKTTCKYTTYLVYKKHIDNHISRVFGSRPLDTITRADVKAFLLSKISKGVNVRTVKGIKAVLSTLFTQAIEDGHIQTNPAASMGKILKAKDRTLDHEFSPLTAEELEVYLDTCRAEYPAYYPLFLTLSRTGMRLGETLGLQWGDIDHNSRFIEIKRAITAGRVTTPKSGKVRRVKMTPQLAGVLADLLTRRKEEKLRRGWADMPEWVFATREGNPFDPAQVRGRVHYRICEKAGLRRFRIHDLRHTYATLRISRGHNIADVQKQLGHASIKITVDTYFHWLPSDQKNEVDDLDNLTGETQPNATYPQPEKGQVKKGKQF